MEIARLSEVLALSALGHGTKSITQHDVQSIVVDFSEIDAGGALDSALTGNLAQALQRFDRQLAQGENPIKLFRLWAYRLGRINDLAQSGLAAKAAIGKARPPIFWKDKPFFEKALNKLGPKGAAKLIEALDTAERNSVERRQPPRLVAEKFLFLAATQKAV
jgi:DNA polymerase-3 subunit delta